MSTTLPPEKEQEEVVLKSANQIVSIFYGEVPKDLQPAVLIKVRNMLIDGHRADLEVRNKESAKIEGTIKQLSE
jgi:hypothetical protein